MARYLLTLMRLEETPPQPIVQAITDPTALASTNRDTKMCGLYVFSELRVVADEAVWVELTTPGWMALQ